jgi:glycosyltransferase involved in cell wall biosynthesis
MGRTTPRNVTLAVTAGHSITNPLHVCLGALVFYPQYAGPAVRFKRYAPGLRRLGVNLSVFSGIWEGTSTVVNGRGRHPTDSPIQVVDGIPIHGVRLPHGHGERSQALHARALARFCEHNPATVDVVQLLNLSPWSMEGLLRLRRAGIPVVLTRTMLTPPAQTFKQRLQRRYARLPYRFLDCVVVSSGVMRDSLRAAGIRGRVEVIPNGVDLGRFRPLPDEARRVLRERLDLDPDGEIILFVGGFLAERKGVDVLAAAWKRIAHARPRASLVLVGPHVNPAVESSIAFVREVKKTITESGAEDRVVLTGEVNNVEEYLQVADVFVFPSRREGMPNVVAEAFASGLPTIMTPFVGLPAEFGQPDKHYVLVDRTASALSEAVTELLDDPTRRGQLAREARRWVEEELDLERSLRLYTSLYHEMARTGKTEWR